MDAIINSVLDIALRGVSFQYAKSDFALRDINFLVPKSTHTALIGPREGAGAFTSGIRS